MRVSEIMVRAYPRGGGSVHVARGQKTGQTDLFLRLTQQHGRNGSDQNDISCEIIFGIQVSSQILTMPLFGHENRGNDGPRPGLYGGHGGGARKGTAQMQNGPESPGRLTVVYARKICAGRPARERAPATAGSDAVRTRQRPAVRTTGARGSSCPASESVPAVQQFLRQAGWWKTRTHIPLAPRRYW